MLVATNMIWLSLVSFLFIYLPGILGVPMSNYYVKTMSVPPGQCQCGNGKETLLFYDRPPEICNREPVPFSLMQSHSQSGVSQCGSAITQYHIDNGLYPATSSPVIYNKCGATMSASGTYICEDCAKSFPPDAQCYFLLQAPDEGAIDLKINVTSMGNPTGSDAALTVYHGNAGRNVFSSELRKPGQTTYTPTGASMMLMLRVYANPTPDISFSFQFTIEGRQKVSTAGCGGVIRDRGIITSPGYPQIVYSEENCVWIFHASYGHNAHVEIQHMQLTTSAGIIGKVVVRDGSEGIAPVIAVLNGSSRTKVKGTSMDLFLHYRTTSSANVVGFLAEFSSLV